MVSRPDDSLGPKGDGAPTANKIRMVECRSFYTWLASVAVILYQL